MTELKPCPFCGSKARIRKFKNYTYAVVCSKCGAKGTTVGLAKWNDSVFIPQGKAIEAWNRRVSDA